MMNKTKSVETLHLLLVQAAETERRMPRGHAKPSVTYWPQYQAEWLSYADEQTHQSLGGATAQQITSYDHILQTIVELCQVEDRKILWVTARMAAFRSRMPWTKIGKALHIDRRTAKRKYEAALLNLFFRM